MMIAEDYWFFFYLLNIYNAAAFWIWNFVNSKFEAPWKIWPSGARLHHPIDFNMSYFISDLFRFGPFPGCYEIYSCLYVKLSSIGLLCLFVFEQHLHKKCGESQLCLHVKIHVKIQSLGNSPKCPFMEYKTATSVGGSKSSKYEKWIRNPAP